MNWFERYGIPGLYISFYVFICVFSVHLDSCQVEDGLGEILTIFAGVSLPAGYLISIFSQWLYYKLPFGQHVHRYAMKKDNLQTQPEELLEARMAILFRVKVDKEIVDQYRWPSEWLSKRVDVIAINNSMIVATILGGALSYVLHDQIFHSLLPQLGVILGVSILIIIIIILNTALLLRQVKRVTKALYEST
jgi:hypothetical protein